MSRTGTENPASKLDDEKVRKIRANRSGWPRWRWAKELNVSLRTIENVASYKTWKHVR